MAAHFDNSKIIHQIVMTLAHFCTVAVALPLLYEFGIETLSKAFFKIKSGNSAESDEDRDISCDKAKEKLLFIPAHLRKDVLEAAHGMRLKMDAWKSEHSIIWIHKKEGERLFLWRSDGTIDTIKTAQQVVLDRNINIRKRFEIACTYGLEYSVRTLWSDMKASEKAKYSETDDHPMVRFWVRWLREGRLVPWTRAAVEYLDIPPKYSRTTRFSAFFPKLRPEDRRKFLIPLRTSLPEDFRFCLYSMTKEEEDETVRAIPLIVLYLYLYWPLQSSFLEMAKKLWNLIIANSFWVLLLHVAHLESREDFDYAELFRELWKRCSDRLRKAARRNKILMMHINLSCNLKRIVDADASNKCINSKIISSSRKRLTQRLRRNGRVYS